MSLPFTYCITHLKTNRKYYGSRYAKGCHPNDLGITYFTSSKIMKSTIISEGIENFKFEIRKTFTTIDKCRSWEHRVLVKLNAAKSDKWFNKHNGGQKFYNIKNSDETRKKISDTHKLNGKLKGIPKSEKVKKAVAESNSKRVFTEEQRKKISKRVSGANNPMYGKIRKDTAIYLQNAKDKMIQANRCPVVCEGFEYQSVNDAQKAYPGISIRKRLDNPNYPDFYRLRERTLRK